MEFDNLKSNWKNSGSQIKSKSELEMMTKVKNHPQLKKIRSKLIVETFLIIIFLFVYYNAFDGSEKPLWINILLSISAILYILNDVFSYVTLLNPVKGISIKNSITKLHDTLQKLQIFSIITSFLFGIALIFFFSSSIIFTNTKYLIVLGIIISLVGMIYFSYKNWNGRIKQIKETIGEFNNE